MIDSQDPRRIIERLVTALHTTHMVAYPEKTHAEIQAEIQRIVGPYEFGAVYEEEEAPAQLAAPVVTFSCAKTRKIGESRCTKWCSDSGNCMPLYAAPQGEGA